MAGKWLSLLEEDRREMNWNSAKKKQQKKNPPHTKNKKAKKLSQEGEKVANNQIPTLWAQKEAEFRAETSAEII